MFLVFDRMEMEMDEIIFGRRVRGRKLVRLA